MKTSRNQEEAVASSCLNVVTPMASREIPLTVQWLCGNSNSITAATVKLHYCSTSAVLLN